MELFGHQHRIRANIAHAYHNGFKCPLVVSPTGSGKTVIFSAELAECNGPSAAIAHRSELVGQMSFALARFGVKHRVIGPKKLIVQINQMHLAKLKRSFYDPNAQCAVVSIQTLTSEKNAQQLMTWKRSIRRWITDEGHHLLRDNMWGEGVADMTNALGLGVTADTRRADGRGLGKDADGLYDTLIEGPQMRELIDAGFLVDYKIYCPPSDLNMDGVEIGANGEFHREQTKSRVKASHIVGDVVKEYLKIARGLRGITFAPDIETAELIAKQFNAAGVPAAAISSNTDIGERAALLAQFECGRLLQLVNVDLFGEGYDLPALEVVSFARPTASFQLYLQQFGRVLRTNDGKHFGIIIDHVGNVIRHGLPDAWREQSLERRERGTRGKRDADVIPVRKCLNLTCMRAYEAIHPACPYCGHNVVPASRKGPEFVDGDLGEIDAETLAKMRGDVMRESTAPKIPYGANDIVAASIRKKHWEKCEAQRALCEQISWWAGWQRYRGLSDAQSYRAFYFRFGVDVLTAQTLPRADTEKLLAKVAEHVIKLSSVVDKVVNKK